MAKKAASRASSKAATNGHSPTLNRMQERLMEMATNIYSSRWGYLESMMDPRRDIEQECGYADINPDDPMELRKLFDRDPIASRVVKLFPFETWGLPPEIYESEDPKAKTPFEEAWNGLGATIGGDNWHDDQECTVIWELLRRADMLSGIGHYGVILLGFNDTPELREPVEGMNEDGTSQIAKKKKSGTVANAKPIRKLLYMRAFDESQVRITQLEADPRNPRYGQPVLYEINFNDVNNQGEGQAIVTIGTKTVHWTRVIHVTDNVLSNEFIGVPRCRPVLHRILDLRKLYGGSAEMFWKGAFPGLSIETQPQLQGDVEIDVEAMRQQMFDYMNSLQRYLTLTGMSAKTLAPAVADPTTQINVQLEAVCIELGVPIRIFKGSERGELASSQDAAAWIDRLKDRQRMLITPRLVVPFINRLIMTGVLPMPERFVTKWPDLASLSEEEQARVGTLIVDVMAKYIQGGLEVLMTPMDFMMRILHFSQDEAEGILEAAIEATETEQSLTLPPEPPAGGAIGPDGQPLPVGPDGQPLGPDGQPLEPEEGEEEPADEEEAAAMEELEALEEEAAALQGKGKPPLKPQVKKKKPVPGFSRNAFCPTGPGGGVDPTCSPGESEDGDITTSPEALDWIEEWSYGSTDTQDMLSDLTDDMIAELRTTVPAKPIKVYRAAPLSEATKPPRQGIRSWTTSRDVAKALTEDGDRILLTATFKPHQILVDTNRLKGIKEIGSQGEVIVAYGKMRERMTSVRNAFCPTGPGGGQDNSCPPNKGGGGSGSSGVAREPGTPPPPGADYNPDVEETDNDGVTKAARVGVSAMDLPPPPPIGRLPNLNPVEREVETNFKEAYENDPDGVADKFRDLVKASTKPGEPLTFGTDDAKALTDVWSHEDPEQRAEYRASLNTPLHQTANAIAKRAFVRELDNLQEGDEILVTVGGCGAGKGYALKNVPEALAMKQSSKIIWDSAGDQNATENPWIQKEAEARGLKVNYVYVHADPYKAWADPERGAIQRAKDPKDGRMVDAKVFADSYALGIKNHAAFYEKFKNSANAKFTFLDNRTKPQLMDMIPEEGLKLNRHELNKYALDAVEKSDAPARVRRGATIGQRIWKGDGI